MRNKNRDSIHSKDENDVDSTWLLEVSTMVYYFSDISGIPWPCQEPG